MCSNHLILSNTITENAEAGINIGSIGESKDGQPTTDSYIVGNTVAGKAQY